MARDIYHYPVRRALEKDGWQITHDPFVLKRTGKRSREVDLGAEKFIAAERGTERIAVEVKSFVGSSFVYEFNTAFGQYAIYKFFLSQKEKWVLICILSSVLLLVTTDIVGDSKEGVEFWHLILEGGIGLVSLLGIFYILRNSFKTKKILIENNQKFSAYYEESEKWKVHSKKYLEGLSSAIDEQLSKWKLTAAEKDVVFLLLKGLSLKEIASVRNTTEKTARVQSISIYSKAGLAGRSELSAFFLEDLLLPQK